MERKKKDEKNMSELWDNFKQHNIHVAGVPERATGTEKIIGKHNAHELSKFSENCKSKDPRSSTNLQLNKPEENY